jgi:hypothetical protein
MRRPFAADRYLGAGNYLATLKTMQTLASIVQRLRPRADDSAPVEPRAQITLVPSRPSPIPPEARA